MKSRNFKGFYEIHQTQQDFTKSNRIHEIHRISQDFIKSTAFHRMSLNSAAFYWNQQDFIVDFIYWFHYEFHYRFHWNGIHSKIHNENLLISVKYCEMLWISWNPGKFCGYQWNPEDLWKHVAFSTILLDFMKSIEISEFHEVQLLLVKLCLISWNPVNVMKFCWFKWNPIRCHEICHEINNEIWWI